MKATLLILGTLMLAAVVMAQTDDVSKPPTREFDSGHCYEYEVKMLTAATIVGDPDQASYPMAADAYHQLDALGQLC